MDSLFGGGVAGRKLILFFVLCTAMLIDGLILKLMSLPRVCLFQYRRTTAELITFTIPPHSHCHSLLLHPPHTRPPPISLSNTSYSPRTITKCDMSAPCLYTISIPPYTILHKIADVDIWLIFPAILSKRSFFRKHFHAQWSITD